MKLLKTKKDKEQFLFWVATLESGVLKKARNTLQYKNGYCCLGVGVACTVPENKIEKLGDTCVIEGYFPAGYEQPKAPKWLQKVDDDFETRTGTSLADRNDNYNWSHKRIAEELLKVYGPEL